MKLPKDMIFVKRQVLVLAVFVIGLAFSQPGYCQNQGIVLLLQQTPAGGGTVTPDVGIHHFEVNTEVVLTAVPKPGYQFVYWLGDVGDPTSNSTIAYLNSPKIIIAVFERIEQKFLITDEMSSSMPIGGVMGTAGDYSNQGYSGGGAKRPHKWRWPVPPDEPPDEPPEPKSDPLPVPRSEGQIPVPRSEGQIPVPESIPEPATGALLGLAGLLAFSRRRANR